MRHPLIGHQVVVPGSTSNLGPGFDALGLALQLYLRVRVGRVDASARRRLTFDFGPMPTPRPNAVERGFRAVAEHRGLDDWPGLHLEIHSEIPMQSGLGSSAAAIVAGLRVAELLVGELPVDERLTIAARLEGHPDNTSPSLLGGLVTSSRGADGRVSALASRWPDDLRLAVATPAVTLDTWRARAALPGLVPFADAVANVQRTALLVHGLLSGDRAGARAVLRDAFTDRLHEHYREPLVPGLVEARALGHPSLLGVFLSGAGPSVAAVCDTTVAPVVGLLQDLYARLGIPCVVREIPVHQPDAQPPG